MNNIILEMFSNIIIIIVLMFFFMFVCIERVKELINVKDDLFFIDYLGFFFVEIL